MTFPAVSNQGFTIHNYICGIDFLSHLRGAPHTFGWHAFRHSYATILRFLETDGDLSYPQKTLLEP
jgi:hypothetical protein